MPKSSHVEPFWEKNAEAFRRLLEQDDAARNLANASRTAQSAGGEPPSAAASATERTLARAPNPVARSKPLLAAGATSAYLTTDEAAQFVRLSPRTLERLRVHGSGPTYLRAGTGKRARILYKVEHLVAWLEGQSYASTSEYTSGGA